MPRKETRTSASQVPESGRIYRFDDAELDTASACLRRAGRELFLRPKAYQVLLFLVRNAGRVVTRQELQAAIWPDVVVTDDALVQCVVEIRKALGDDSRAPRYVRTTPKSGYRFVGGLGETSVRPVRLSVEEVTSLEVEYEEDVASASRALPAALASFPRRAAVGIAAAVLVAALGALRWGAWMPRREPLPAAAAPIARSLVVGWFENRSGSKHLDWLREGLPDMLITDLSQTRGFSVLSRQQLRSLLARTRGSGREAELELARKTKADALLAGSFTTLGERLRIDVQVQDPATGRIVSAESLTLDRPEEVLSRIDLLAAKLAATLGAPADGRRALASAMTDDLEAYRAYSLAVAKAEALHNGEALALLAHATERDPGFAMAHARIGYVYAITAGDAEKGRPYLEKAFRLSARLGEKDRLTIAAWYAVASLDFPGAIAAYRKLLAAYPLETSARTRLGLLLLGEEQSDEAVRVLKEGIAIDPEDPDLQNRLAGTYAELGQGGAALPFALRYVALAPGEANAHDTLGLVYQTNGEYAKAVAEYERAIEIGPRFEIAVRHLGNVFARLGRYREALRQFERYRALAPSSLERTSASASIAAVHLRKGDLDRAAEAAAGLEADPQLGWLPSLVALARGDRAAAKALEEWASTETPATSRGIRPTKRWRSYCRGVVAMANGRTEDALGEFREALRHWSPIFHAETYDDCLAAAFVSLERWPDAVAECERLLRANPNDALARFRLGLARRALGDVASARKELGRFLETWQGADEDVPELVRARREIAALAPLVTRLKAISPRRENRGRSSSPP